MKLSYTFRDKISCKMYTWRTDSKGGW